MELHDDNEVVTPPDTITEDLFQTVLVQDDQSRRAISPNEPRTISVAAVHVAPSPSAETASRSSESPAEQSDPPIPAAEKLKVIEIDLAFVNKKARVFSDRHSLSGNGEPEVQQPTSSEAEKKDLSEIMDMPSSVLFSKVKIQLNDLKEPEKASFGELLRQGREIAGFSIAQVAEYTKLREFYIQSLESVNLKELPPAVYVIAYVNSLSELYGMDEECRSLLKEKLRILPDRPAVPSKLIEELASDVLVNEAENKRIRNMFIAFISGVAVLLIIGAWAIVSHFVSASRDSGTTEIGQFPEAAEVLAEEPSAQAKLNESDYEPLISPQVPETTVLKMSASPGVSR